LVLAGLCLAPVGCGVSGTSESSASLIQPPSGPPAAPGLPPTLAGASVSARSGKGTAGASATFTPTLALSGYNAIGFQHLTIDAISGAGQVLGLAYWTGTDYQFGNLTVPEINALGTTRGYWLFTGGPTTFTYTGNDLSGNRSAQLGFGWNLVAFPAQQDVQASTLQTFRAGQPVSMISVIATDFFEVNTSNQNVPVNVLAPGASLRAGRAYWVYAAESVTLTYTVPQPTPTPTPTVTPLPSPSPQPGTGRLYVPSDGVNRLLVFDGASALNGDVGPSRSVSGPATGVDRPSHIALDIQRDTMYVSQFVQNGSLLAFSPASTINGDAAPVRTLTGLDRATTLCFDAVHDRLYVSVDGPSPSVLVFDNVSSKSGAATPSRQLTGFAGIIRGIAADPASDRLYVAVHEANQISVFDNVSTKSGAQSGLVNRVVSGPATLVDIPAGLVYDAPADRLYCATYTARILAFNNASTMDGNQAPARAVSGTATRLVLPSTLQLDRNLNQLYVSNTKARVSGSGGDVLVFNDADTMNGNVAPARVLAGPNTGFEVPGFVGGIALDPQTPLPSPSPNPTPTPTPAGNLGALTFQRLQTLPGTGPNFPTFTPDGRFIYVPLFNGNSVVGYAVDGTTGNLTQVPGSPFLNSGQPGAATVHPAGTHLYISNALGDSVNVYSINGGTGAITLQQTIGAGDNPLEGAIAVTTSGTYFYTANFFGRSVSRYRVEASGNLTALGNTSTTGATTFGNDEVIVSPDNRHLYTSSGVGLSIIAATGDLAPLPGSPYPGLVGAIGQTIDGRFVYGAAEAGLPTEGLVTTYSRDQSTGVLTVTGTAQLFPTGFLSQMEFDRSGRFMYAGDNVNNGVFAFTVNGQNGALTPIPGSPFPSGGPAGTQPTFFLTNLATTFGYSFNRGANSVSTFSIQSGSGADR